MTPKEAAEEMEKRFPGQIFACEEEVWDKKSTSNSGCKIFYNFNKHSCEQIKSSTFEECFGIIDKELTRQALLLRQF